MKRVQVKKATTTRTDKRDLPPLKWTGKVTLTGKG